MGWLDYRSKSLFHWLRCTVFSYLSILTDFALTMWLRRNTLDRLTLGSDTSQEYSVPTDVEVWKDRREAEAAIDSYLSDFPCSCFSLSKRLQA